MLTVALDKLKKKAAEEKQEAYERFTELHRSGIEKEKDAAEALATLKVILTLV